jgi:hypothetical protein
MTTPLRSSRAPYLMGVLGVVAGAILALAISSVMARGSKRGLTTASAEAETDSAPANTTTQKVAELAALAQVLRATPVARPEAAEPVGDPAPPPRLQTAAQMLAQHDADVEKHYREPIDGRWAPAASKAFGDDLAGAVDQLSGHFKVTELDCRSDTCVAALQWPSRNEALNEWNDLLTFPYRANCGRTIIIPEPAADGSDQAAPVRAKLLFDCSESKDSPIRQQPLTQPLAVNRRPAAAN